MCERCAIANGVFTRLRGLLGRKDLPRGEGLLIKPTWSIHTGFMRFAIDAVFLDEELKVLDVRREIKPWRAAARFRAKSVLELAAGECERVGIRLGDRLAWAS